MNALRLVWALIVCPVWLVGFALAFHASFVGVSEEVAAIVTVLRNVAAALIAVALMLAAFATLRNAGER